MGLAILIAGIAVFVGVHTFVTMREARAGAIERLGRGPYMLGFSLLSALGIALMAYGFGLYRATGWVELWTPPIWTRHLAAALVLPAVILIVAAYVPGRIKARLKHPMLAGVKLWALAHLIANGDLGSLVLFGSILAWAVFDRIAVKRREAAGEMMISTLPAGWRNDGIAIAVGLLAYLALGFFFHPWAIGVPAFGA